MLMTSLHGLALKVFSVPFFFFSKCFLKLHMFVDLFGFLIDFFRGYLAPEYAIRGQVTRKADIYSFGVLVLEIVSGRCNTNRRLPPKEQYLLERV